MFYANRNGRGKSVIIVIIIIITIGELSAGRCLLDILRGKCPTSNTTLHVVVESVGF